jgi:hypothetical protein
MLAASFGLIGVGLKSYFQLPGTTAGSVRRLTPGVTAFRVTILLQNEDGFLKNDRLQIT